MPLTTPPGPTVRARLTALYCGLFLTTGLALLTIAYFLQKRTIDSKSKAILVDKKSMRPWAVTGDDGVARLQESPEQLSRAVAQIRSETLHHLLVFSILSFAVLAVVGVIAGWWLAGRVLRPLQRIIATARRLSWQNLNERIELQGPPELKTLADTFDDMLARLERAFAGQRNFMASVSHELRTPLAIQRAALQIGLADPDPANVARVRDELLETNRRSERLINGLLMLARSESGLDHREPVALDEVAREAIDLHSDLATEKGVRVTAEIRPTVVSGDPVLLAQLVANLLANGIRHNHRGGLVEVVVSPDMGLCVRNTGPVVPAERVDRLFAPFQRMAASSGHDEGVGLGLSIVRSIAGAHGTRVSASPQPAGGLDIRVPVPPATPVATGRATADAALSDAATAGAAPAGRPLT